MSCTANDPVLRLFPAVVRVSTHPTRILLIILSILLYTTTALGQPTAPGSERPTPKVSDTAAKKAEKPERKIQLTGMLIARYTVSSNEAVDVNGQHHTAPTGYSTNGFAVRRVRLQAKAALTPRADVAVSLNATDFTGNPSNKVLENALVKYRFTDYLNLQVGQYRPYWGKEDLYPEEQLETFEWSNTYYAFGPLGWQSFQTGATLFGKVAVARIPLTYYIGVVNANGRNQAMDNNNGKLFPVRLEAALRPQTKLGLNAGWGHEGVQRTWAAGADIDHRVQLADRWALHLQAEYKTAFNTAQFFSDTAAKKVEKDYRLSGLYVLPFLSYSIHKGSVQSAALSMRWETLDLSGCTSNNRRRTCCPMVCVLLSDPCNLRLELGAIINNNEFNVPNTTSYDHTRYICQVKAGF